MAGAQLIRSPRWALAALAYLACIYASLPLARPVWRRIEPSLAGRASLWFLVAGVVVAAALAVRAWTASPRRRAGGVALLVAALGAYVVLLGVFYHGRVTLEKAHLIEYGALAYFALNAVWVARRGGPGLILALAFTVAAGTGDELLQKVVPERYCDFYDMVGNWLGGALGALAWWGASARSPMRREPSARRA